MQSQSNILANFDNISNLIENQIPQQSKSLSDNVVNLEKVAQYCEDIYVNSKEANKQYFLHETKGYTNQALASVAYQIHVLSNSFLQLLENQSAIINDMNVSISHLAHDVSIHKEKVARREIGFLTSDRTSTNRTPQIKRPDVDEKPVKYIRKPIDYSILDDVGHGVKLKGQSSNQQISHLNFYSSLDDVGGSNDTLYLSSSNLPLSVNALKSVSLKSNLNFIPNTVSIPPVSPPTLPVTFSTIESQITFKERAGSASIDEKNLTIIDPKSTKSSSGITDRTLPAVGDDEDDIIPNWVPIDRCIEKVITTYDYEGEKADELSFKENMYIYVIKKNDDHWYEGIMKNENGEVVIGLYPYNYAKCIRKYANDSRITQC